MTTLQGSTTAQPFGTTDGLRVDRWTLERDDVRVDVLTYGARLHGVHVPDRYGQVENVVVGPNDLAGHLADQPPYAGGIVGRWANRLANGRVRVGATDHDLAANEGSTTLHGGPDAYDKRLWSAASVDDADSPAVRMHLRSPDGDNGFPGALDVTATYRLLDRGALDLELEASTDAPTVVNLTTHTYWDLSGDTGVAGHRLRVPAGRYVAVDERLLPTGVAPTAGTPFDLRRGPLLEQVLQHVDIDHCYLLDGEVAAQLIHTGSGRRLTVVTNQPAVQVYLGGQLPRPHAALAIEPQMAPDAPNRPDLPLGPVGLLRPGERYVHRMRLHFDVD